jgi:peptidyl-prolyl cis-trans isomerase B (cyclophilin B)
LPVVGKKKREMQRHQARMRRSLMIAGVIVAIAAVAGAAIVFSPSSTGPPGGGPPAYAVISTQSGTIVFRFIEDHPKVAITTANFIGLVQGGYYNGLPWHRVEAGFVIQTGDKPSDPRPSIPLELDPTLHNDYGTVGVARTNEPNSGSTQFYINTGSNRNLDTTNGGYAVFGVVTRGMENATRVTQGEMIFSISFVRSATPP